MDAAADLYQQALQLIQDDAKIIRLRPKVTKKKKSKKSMECRELVEQQRSFHYFGRLPAELKLMIWEAAVQPPPCIHFFLRFANDPHRTDRPPVAYLMDDGGLWTACQESRRVIYRAYREQHRHIFQTGCCTATKALEQHYRRLSRFCSRSSRFSVELRLFPDTFWKFFTFPESTVLNALCDTLCDLNSHNNHNDNNNNNDHNMSSPSGPSSPPGTQAAAATTTAAAALPPLLPRPRLAAPAALVLPTPPR
ncbi:hypothetical protein SPI_03805 [Niveomyces insectorum RCEF 264]|uniref:2EXR domain-containing protein n=1 Tax=Niveomyces insectorum RCEF 264 TaxID=1081102 RepID=A0A162J4M7_9HYPO|nr:hypothetical protein SPI_03805 [Niveomyces insectorum RCEF 264]